MKVDLFVTCLVDQLFPEVGLATVKLLCHLGVSVEFDDHQTCCGQPAFNTGYPEEARCVGRRLLHHYADSEAIVVPSGSCAAMIKKHLPSLFEEDSYERAEMESIGDRTFELSDFIVNKLGVTSTGACFKERVTFHDSCHQLRELGIFEQPRTLIRSVEGIEFIEMENSTRCCGFGGTFSVKFPELSSAIGSDKVRWIQESGARYVVGADVSCLMHIDGLMRRAQLPVSTMHLAELLTK